MQIVSRLRGTLGIRTDGDTGSVDCTSSSVSMTVSPLSGGRPVIISYIMAPTE